MGNNSNEPDYNKYKLFGFFKIINGQKHRTKVIIENIDDVDIRNTAFVIMINPGSFGSSLDSNNYLKDGNEIKNPDPTLKQIIRVMKFTSLKRIIVLNLYTNIEAKLCCFKTIMEYRPELINKYFVNDNFDFSMINDEKFVILAWGVLEGEIARYAQNVTNSILLPKIALINKSYSDKDFAKSLHPLPPNYQKQENWVSEIVKQINNLK